VLQLQRQLLKHSEYIYSIAADFTKNLEISLDAAAGVERSNFCAAVLRFYWKEEESKGTAHRGCTQRFTYRNQVAALFAEGLRGGAKHGGRGGGFTGWRSEN